jgi:hypothetical protein
MRKHTPLIIDSSILKQIPKLNSELMKELIKCIRAGIFSLYVPEVIEQEFLTWLQKEIQEAFDSVAKANRSLSKYYEEPSILGMKFDFSETSTRMAHTHMNGILKKAAENWYDFKKGTSATDLPIKGDHASAVMQAYFKGDKPFSFVKDRNDIPGAFIYCCIVDLLNNNDEVVFISQDKKLIKRISSERIICFDNIPSLFSIDKYKVNDNFFCALKDDDLIVTLIRLNQEYINYKSKSAIEYSDPIFVFEEGLQDQAVGNFDRVSTATQDFSIDIKSIRRISELSALVEFKVLLEHTVVSHSSSVELSMIAKERLNRIEHSNNDNGEVELEEKHYSTAKGSISITFDNSQPSTWSVKECPFNIMSDIEEISIQLEDVELLEA